MDYVTPTGFRDILPDEALVRERLSQSVQGLFDEAGYVPVETPTLERMDAMNAAGHIPGATFKLFDAQGELLALRPDVTMQVARMVATRLRGMEDPIRLRYTQRVFRDVDTQFEAREMTQVGIECIGPFGTEADAEVVGLCARALAATGLEKFTVALGTVAVLRSLLEACKADGAWKNQVLAAYHASNFVALDALCSQPEVPEEFAQAVRSLPRIRGGREAIEEAKAVVEPLGCAEGLDEFAATFDVLANAGLADDLLVDFSIMSSFDYYTGIVFEAYAPGMGELLGSGGRYDTMLEGLGAPARPAAGFSFYLEHVMEAFAAAENAVDGQRPLRVAVPKGSLNEGSIRVLREAGLDTTGLEDPGRQLVISNPGVDYIIVRPTDAPVFVALGAADCGICGNDSLVESGADVVELVDLCFGACTFVVAQPAGTTEAVEKRYRKLGSMRIATKYPNITRRHFDAQGVQVEVVQLHGNIELAPMVGMAERIVDITATGTTLRENNLEVVENVMDCSARFFANSAAFRMDKRVVELARNLKR
ncbi:MAG: ATP phosphoribosyltransferase regulatory subunit [Eggerthellaceae bacterium]|nr:ATP phosphoribosyltransferase regulatory subunit [Eggerthellaceae bacterium]